MDLGSPGRWEDYSRAEDEMFPHTDPEARRHVLDGEDKRRARVNMIAHVRSADHATSPGKGR